MTPIPDDDPEGVASELVIASSPFDGEEQIHVRIAHTYRGDLRVDLVAPDGTERTLLAPDGGDDGDDVDERFTLELTDTDPRDGVWRLIVRDVAPLDTGTLLGWSLGVGAPAP